MEVGKKRFVRFNDRRKYIKCLYREGYHCYAENFEERLNRIKDLNNTSIRDYVGLSVWNERYGSVFDIDGTIWMNGM